VGYNCHCLDLRRFVRSLRSLIMRVLSRRPSLPRYRRAVRERFTRSFYRERHFETAEQWAKLAGSGHRGWGMSEYHPTLDSLLNNRAVVILGEPGAGKSTSARAAMLKASEREWIPFFAPLREYHGSINSVIQGPLPLEADDSSRPRLFVLDGFDEIPEGHLEGFATEIREIESRDPNARFLLTSRQAFFVAKESLFSRRWPTFYIDDLSTDDVDAFIANAGVDRLAFRTALGGVDLHSESHNPFVLEALLKFFAARGTLPETRSEAVCHLIDATLDSRPASDRRLQRRALRMLAIAMEIYAYNELPLDNAVAVLRKSVEGLTEVSATRLVEELAQSILLRTKQGVCFQMRSYGEYLAAEELSAIQEPNRSLSLMLVTGQRVLGASWANCATFLAEMHPGFRRIVARQFPEAVLAAAPSKFSVADKRSVVDGVMEGLAQKREFLTYHPVVHAYRLAPFVSTDDIDTLRGQLASTDEVRVGNAAMLLGAVGDSASAEQIFAIGLDPSRSAAVRHSALSELGRIGTAAMVPQLLGADSADISTVRLGVAATLMDRPQFGAVLMEVAKCDTTIGDVWQRFDGLHDPSDVLAILEVITTISPAEMQANMFSYLSKLWKSAGRLWRPAFAPLLGDLICNVSYEGAYSLVSDDLIKGVRDLPDGGDAVGEYLAAKLAERPELTNRLDNKAYAIIPLAAAKRLKETGAPQVVLTCLRAMGRPEVAAYFRPNQPVGEPDDPQFAEFKRRQAEREAETQSHFDRLDAARTGIEVCDGLVKIDRKKWPELRRDQVDAMRDEASKYLVAANLRTAIEWVEPNRWRVPGSLWLVLEAIDRYECALPNDRPLVLTLLGHESEKVLRYFHRHGLSDGALSDAVGLLADDALYDQALHGVLRFWRDAGARDPRVIQAARALAQGTRDMSVREAALEVVLKNDADEDAIAALATSLTGDLKERAELDLLTRGHRPTAERRLSALLANPALLAAGDTDSPFHNPLNWIGMIRSPEVWSKLEALRKLALQNQLGTVTQIITTALGNIDLLKLADVVTNQVQYAPSAWQPFQRRQAREFHRDGTIRAAQATPFEMVLRKMKLATTLERFKIWTEGWKDVPAIERLILELPDEVADAIVVDCFNGWATVLGSNWRPERLWDGCHDLIVLLDGDRARDFSKPNRPIKPDSDVRAGLRRMDEARVGRRILERYAFENYFPPSAFEAVIGAQPAGVFPLDETRPVSDQITAYSKNMNDRLAAATRLTDLGGTDLGSFFQEVHDRVA
jgi:hypothetical protein